MMNYLIQSLLRPNPPLLPPPPAAVGETGEPLSKPDPCVESDAEILSEGKPRAATASPRLARAMDDIHQERSGDHAGTGYVMPPEDQFQQSRSADHESAEPVIHQVDQLPQPVNVAGVVTDNDVAMMDQIDNLHDKSNSEQINNLHEMVVELSAGYTDFRDFVQ